ncbi:MAG TPA: protein translocase subunit SecD [Acidimicrobiales bacterium]|nr:protein translocase subunit SecD [Acidimicrobiales bacterium]
MRTRPLVWCLVLIIAVAVIGVGATIATGTTPLLGLDLKGGVSVVEKPQGHVTAADLQESQQIINNRVNGLGVSNSSVTVQGNNIVIELPGAKNDTEVLKVVGQTAQLFFRPVDCVIAPYVASSSATTTTTTTHAHTTTTKAAAGATGGPVVHLDAHLASANFPLAAGTTTVPTTGPTTSSGTSSTTAPASLSRTNAATSTSTAHATTATTAHPTTTTTVPHPLTSTALGTQICSLTAAQQPTYFPPHGTSHGVTPAAWDLAGSTVVLPQVGTGGSPAFADGRYVLGPAEMSGSIIKTAAANLNSQTDEWEVDLTFTSRGSTEFNKYATAHYACYEQDPSNPPYCALQAIELDAVVQSAPAIEAASYPGGATISGSSSNPFTQQQASNLALSLSYGSLPVRFVPQDISSVSPQIGTDSLKAGAIAGALAVLLVLLYLVIYYRALGLVVVVSICISGALLYAITTLLSQTEGLALTLSGVIGLIVSVGVTADSCVVYFERLKEEIRGGRTVRTSVEKGFNRAFRTVLAADFSSFIAAFILYTLTVGDVRGFAFFLGLATLLNVVTTYLFTRPLVILIGRRASVSEGGFLGVNRGLGVSPLTT